MSVTGKWVNIFNSVVYLEQTGSGVIGVYTSTTGSSGAYWVIGSCNPAAPAGTGQSLALSIFWRSINGGQGDPSWHYVSGFSGQLVTLDNVPTLSLVHDLVATAPFPPAGINADGSYLDKLLYTPYTGDLEAPAKWPPEFTTLEAPTALDGNWTCVQNPELKLSLAVQDQYWGYLTGTLQTPEGNVGLAGFTDTYAGSDNLAIQGVTVSALLPDNQTVVALAGSLDLSLGSMSLSWLQSSGTAPSLTWVQTSLQGLYFTKTS